MADLTFLTTETENDLYLDEVGNIATGDDLQSIIQRVKNKIRTIRGELQLNITDGIPYFETLLKMQSPDVGVWESYAVKAALAVNDVLGVKSMVSKITDNVLSYRMEIETIYGMGVVEE